MGGSHMCRKPRWGDPISAGNLDGEIPIPTGSKTWDPISVGNLDGGGGCPISAGHLDWGSHISRNPRSEGIPYLLET